MLCQTVESRLVVHGRPGRFQSTNDLTDFPKRVRTVVQGDYTGIEEE